MGRFYEIVVGSRTWSSQIGGRDNPGALDVEFEVYEYAYGIPDVNAGNSTITIHGVPLDDLQSAANFAGNGTTLPAQQIKLAAGMSSGFPLVHPQQRGTILQGQVFQSFGNWTGTDMTLDFVVVPSVFTMASPGNFVLNWQKGTSLQDALTQTLAAAYANVVPTPKISFHLEGTYVAKPLGHVGRYSTLTNLATAIESMTKAASPGRRGVKIAFLASVNTIEIYDADALAATSKTVATNFTDLVGQPTWIDVFTMQVTFVMRADLRVGSYLTMPQGLPYAPGGVATAGSAFGGGVSGPQQLKYQSAFQGVFLVQSLRHVGNFRDPNGTSWVTIAECVPVTVS